MRRGNGTDRDGEGPGLLPPSPQQELLISSHCFGAATLTPQNLQASSFVAGCVTPPSLLASCLPQLAPTPTKPSVPTTPSASSASNFPSHFSTCWSCTQPPSLDLSAEEVPKETSPHPPHWESLLPGLLLSANKTVGEHDRR